MHLTQCTVSDHENLCIALGCLVQNSIHSARSHVLPAFLPLTKRSSSCWHREIIALSVRGSFDMIAVDEKYFWYDLSNLPWNSLFRVLKTFENLMPLLTASPTS